MTWTPPEKKRLPVAIVIEPAPKPAPQPKAFSPHPCGFVKTNVFNPGNTP